jgi:hypothetical protein
LDSRANVAGRSTSRSRPSICSAPPRIKRLATDRNGTSSPPPGRQIASECPDHHADLTGLVEEALEDQGPPFAYRRLLPGRKAPGLRPFQVIVTCPGTGTGEATPHSLTCTGIQTQ